MRLNLNSIHTIVNIFDKGHDIITETMKLWLPGGEEMVQVKIFDEWLNSGSLLDLLLAHDFSNSSGSSFNTSNEGMSEFSFLGQV